MQEANTFMKSALPLAALLVAALAGCSSLSWFGQPEPRPVPRAADYGDDDAVVAALEACRAQARAVIQRDTAIDRDIATGDPAFRGAPGLDWRSEGDLDLIQNMDQFETGQRYERIVADCMRRKGYAPADEEPES